MSSLPAACTFGMATPARADAAARRPVGLINSRREVGLLEESFIRTTSPATGGMSMPETTMKAKIIITPKKAVLDPQDKTVQNALAHIGYTEVGAVHVGKYLEIELTGTDREAARKQIDEACHRILSNPVIEDYQFEIE